MSTIAFFPEGAYGPTNNCVGIGDVLRGRGHRVVFIVEESFAGALEAQGFEERLMRLAPPPEEPEVPGQFWKDFIRETAPVFRKPTIEQLGDFIAPTFQALIDGLRNTGAVSRMKSFQNCPGTSGSSGGGASRIRRSSKPWAASVPAKDSSMMNTTRWPRRRRTSPIPTQLLVGP